MTDPTKTIAMKTEIGNSPEIISELAEEEDEEVVDEEGCFFMVGC